MFVINQITSKLIYILKMKKTIALIALSCTLFVGCKNESAEKEKIALDNIKSYTKTWDLVVNEGKIDVLDTAYA